MLYADRAVGRVDGLASRAAGAIDVDAQVVGVYLDLDFVCLRQYENARSGRVDAPSRFRDRDPLHPVHTCLHLQARVGALPFNREDDLLETAYAALVRGQNLRLEPSRLRVARVHAIEVGGEQAGFVTPGSRPNLDDHVAVVVGILREQGLRELVLELLDGGLLLAYLLIEVGAFLVGRVRQHRSRLIEVVRGAPVPPPRLDDRLELGVFLAEPPKLVGTGGNRRIGKLKLYMLEARLHLLQSGFRKR